MYRASLDKQHQPTFYQESQIHDRKIPAQKWLKQLTSSLAVSVAAQGGAFLWLCALFWFRMSRKAL